MFSKTKAFEPASERLELHLDARELAGTTGLFLVREVDLGRTADLLTIRHLRLADIGLNLELALQAVDQDVEVKLAHALHDRLAGFKIGFDAERRVFRSKALQA